MTSSLDKKRSAFTRPVRTTSAAGLSVSRHLKAHVRCSVVVGLFDVCWPPANRVIPSTSRSIWFVGVCNNCRGTSWCCSLQMKHCFGNFVTVGAMYLLNCCHRNLQSDTQHNLRKRRHNLTLPGKKGHLAAKNFIIRLLYRHF